MKTIAIFATLLPLAFFAFRPLTIDEKSLGSDLIVVGKVVSVNHLIPEDIDAGFKKTDPRYFGPRSVAVVEVIEAWKQPENTRSFTLDPVKSFVPKYIMVPCNYSFAESPSDLTDRTTYVMFLKQLGNNIFHPLDPASTHVVSNGRVANFGMNHPVKPEFVNESIETDDFKEQVLKIISDNAKVDEPLIPTPENAR